MDENNRGTAVSGYESISFLTKYHGLRIYGNIKVTVCKISKSSKLSCMIFKVHKQDSSHISQGAACSIEQIVFADIIMRFNPFSLKYLPKRLGEIQVWGIWRKKVHASCLPELPVHQKGSCTVDSGVVEDDNRLPAYLQGFSIKILHNLVSFDGICRGETVIVGVAAYDSEAVESVLLARGDMVVISLACTNALKKRLKVESLVSLDVEVCQTSLAAFTLCLSFSIAERTVSSSEVSILGFAPCPGWFSKPWMLSSMNRLTHMLIEGWHMPVIPCILGELLPSASKSTTWHLRRRKCALPYLNPFSRIRYVPNSQFGFRDFSHSRN